MKRVLSIWLPHLAIERWAKSADSPPDASPEQSRRAPVVLTVEGTHGPILHAVTRGAADRGARAGARLTDARALDPGLVAVPADPAGDAALVERLARWAARWSPLVEVDGPDGLRLDVSGVAHLFGGEAALVADVEARFAAMGLTARVAIAPTAAAAWGLAHYQPLSPLREREGPAAKRWEGEGIGAAIPSPRSAAAESPSPARGEGLDVALAPLPVSALRLDPDTVRTLQRLGLKTIGALLDLPRLALARRFRGAESVVDALDRLTGRKAEPLTAAPADPPPRATLRFEEPATHPEAASQALERLIPELVRQLEERHLGARRLGLTGFRIDGNTATAGVTTTIPSREPGHLQRLLAGIMESGAAALDPGFGFDAFALAAEWTEPLGAAQNSLVEEPDGAADVARLIDRLTVKLGPERVRRPVARESHVPERAVEWVSAVNSSLSRSDGEGNHAKHGGGVLGRRKTPPPSNLRSMVPLPTGCAGREEPKRPPRLLDRAEAIDVIYATPEGMPRRFVWRRSVHDIARAEGPERIAPEWWREPSSTRLRDYYRVEDATGRRFWIYREGLIGDGRGGVPNWFVHGLFG